MRRILLALAFLLSSPLYAQEHHELGFMLGVANYYGDLEPKLFPSYGYKPMVGAIYKYFMSPHIGLRTGFSYTQLTAADDQSDISENRARNLSFTTDLLELHAALEINFMPVEIKKQKFSPYIFGGIAAFYFNPYAKDNSGSEVYLRPLSTEGEGIAAYPDRKAYSLVNMSFPFGGGLKFFIGRRFLLTTELGFRYTNTDYLDDVSKSYIDLPTLQAYKGLLASQMAYRGNTLSTWTGVYPSPGTPRGDNQANDWYWYGNVTFTVFFRSFSYAADYIKTKCPRVFR